MSIFDNFKKRFRQIDEVKELREKIKSSPNNPSLHQKLAERLIKRGEYSEAISEYYTAASLFEKGGFGLKSIAVFRQCLRVDPGNIETEKKLIGALVNNGLTGDAIFEFQKIMGDKRLIADAATREDFIGFCLHNLGDIPEIHSYIIKDCLGGNNTLGIISSIEKTVPTIVSRRQLENFHAFLEGIIMNVDDTFSLLEVYSLSLLSAGFKDKGREVIEKIENEQDLDEETKTIVEEVKDYFQEVDSDTSFPKYFSAVPEYFESLKEREEEKEKLEVPEEKEEEKETEGEEDIGAVLNKLREKVETEIGEEDLNARYNLGIAFKEMGLYEEAIREFDIANKDPNLSFSSMLMLKDCYESLEKFEEAIAIIDELLEKGGGDDTQADLDLLYQKAEILDKTGNMEESKALYMQIYDLDENFRDVAERIKNS